MIRIATPDDLPAIMAIVKGTVAMMLKVGSTQWDENYSTLAHFASDIAAGSLHVAEQQGQVVGFVCLNTEEPEGYKALSWPVDCPALVLHRIAIAVPFRRQGVGSRLMAFAEQLARQQGAVAIRCDTYSLNANMNRMFTQRGYQFVGEMYQRGRPLPFNVYVKAL